MHVSYFTPSVIAHTVTLSHVYNLNCEPVSEMTWQITSVLNCFQTFDWLILG